MCSSSADVIFEDQMYLNSQNGSTRLDKFTHCFLVKCSVEVLCQHCCRPRLYKVPTIPLWFSINKLCRRPPQCAPRSLQVDLWPFDLESGVRVTFDVGYLCANFSLRRPLCFRLRPDVRDRQTDVRCTSSLNAPTLGAGHNNSALSNLRALRLANWCSVKLCHDAIGFVVT